MLCMSAKLDGSYLQVASYMYWNFSEYSYSFESPAGYTELITYTTFRILLGKVLVNPSQFTMLCHVQSLTS